MDNTSEIKIHWSFWLISVLMLVWNLMGGINFLIQMNPEMIASYRETEQAIIQGRPSWATISFAIAVFGGAIACVVLLLRRALAYYLFIISLLGVILTTIHTLSIDADFSMGEMAGIIFMPNAVAIFLVWYSKYAERKLWLR